MPYTPISRLLDYSVVSVNNPRISSSQEINAKMWGIKVSKTIQYGADKCYHQLFLMFTKYQIPSKSKYLNKQY